MFVVAPLLQSTVVPADGTAVSTTFLFAQKLAVGPFVIDIVGIGREVTVIVPTIELQRLASVAVTVYTPAVFTVVVFVVAPLLQSTVDPAEGTAVSTTFLFAQKLAVGPFEIDTVGMVRGVTITLAAAELQRLVPVAVTVYVPAVFTVMLFVVAPVLQRTVAPAEGTAVSTTFLFAQKLAVGPLLILTVGSASCVTTTLLWRDWHAFVPMEFTVYVPGLLTEIAFVVAPVLQRIVAPADGTAVRVTFPPLQKLAVGPLEIETVGIGSLVSVIGNDVLIQPSASVAVKDTVLVFDTVMEFVVAPLLHNIVEGVVVFAVNVTEEPSQKFVPLEVILTVGTVSL